MAREIESSLNEWLQLCYRDHPAFKAGRPLHVNLMCILLHEEQRASTLSIENKRLWGVIINANQKEQLQITAGSEETTG